MKINKNPAAQDVRRFALLWTAFAAAMGALLFWRHHEAVAKVLWGACVLVGLSGIMIPIAARAFYRIWMSLAFAINWVITHLLLALIFWGVLAPLALVFKLIGRDTLRLRRLVSTSNSYWLEHDKMDDKSSYQHLY
jgi:hypothetical protein